MSTLLSNATLGLRVRDFRISDIEAIDRIHKKQPSLGVPALGNMLANRVIELDGRVIGYAVIKLFAEGVLILDQEERKAVRAEVIKEVMDESIGICADAGIEQYYITTSHPGFREILRNRYGFVECPDKFLLLNLR